jgi:hypothetical protein
VTAPGGDDAPAAAPRSKTSAHHEFRELKTASPDVWPVILGPQTAHDKFRQLKTAMQRGFHG